MLLPNFSLRVKLLLKTVPLSVVGWVLLGAGAVGLDASGILAWK